MSAIPTGPTTQFQISSDWTGQKHTLNVEVWPTRAQLLDHLNAINPWADWFEENEAGEMAAGAFVNEAGFMSNEAPEFLGTIYLNEEHLDINTIVHEVTHAAMFLYSCDVVGIYARATAHMTMMNEPFAYLMGDLMEQMAAKIMDAGLFTS